MTRFEALQEQFSRLNDQKSQYKASCLNMATRLVRGFQVHLGVEADRIQLYAVSQNGQANQPSDLPPERAMELGDDGFYRLGLALLLTPPRQQLPRNVLTYHLLIRQADDTFYLKCGKQCQQHEVPAYGDTQEAGLTALYEEMYQVAQDFLTHSFDDFIHQRAHNRPIGFRPSAERPAPA